MKKIIPFILLFLLLSCNENQNKIIANKVISLKIFEFNFKKAKIEFDSLFQNLDKNTSFNGIFLAAKNGKIIYENYSGYADFEKKDSLNKNSVFQLASVSKQFVSTSIIYLKTQNSLNYYDKVSKYLTDFPYQNITIENLLNHSSGLQNYVKITLDDNFYTNPSNQSVYDFFCNNKPELKFIPSSQLEYCNTNYVFLVLLVEKISGKKFYDFLKTTFFDKLNMNSTFIFQDPIVYSLNTQGYFSKWNKASKNYFDNVYGDKSIYTTAEDMLKWDQALYNDSIINQTELSNIFEKNNIISNFDEKTNIKKEYQFGWVFAEIENYGEITYHTGHWSGYNSLFFRDIKNKNTIIILCNVTTNEIYFNFENFLNILEPKLNGSHVNLY